MSKLSKFVPLVGTIGGAAMVILDGFNDLNFTLDATSFWAFMTFTVGGSAAIGIYERISKK